MNQNAEKIYNIEHVGNFNVDGFPEMADKLNQAIASIPDLIETTLAMLLSRNLPPNQTMVVFDDVFYKPLQASNREEPKIGDIVLFQWQINQCIGKGGISSVYEVHHTDLGPQCRSAIKVMNSNLQYSPIVGAPGSRHLSLDYRMETELDCMVDLQGTGYIVDYKDHEKIINNDGSWSLILRMELLESLPNILRKKSMLRRDVIRLGIDICRALEYCFKDDIIHCDVKPSNIYVTKWGGYKLGDFSASIRSNTQWRDRMGTPKYMTPEAYHSKALTPSSDIYSLGIVLYEQFAGTPSTKDALSHRLSGEPLPPIPGLDKKLQSIILKACAFRPEDRFSTPTEMLEELLKVGKK